MKLSRRSGTIEQSHIRSMTGACNAVGGINMAQGVCDLPVPSEVIEGAKWAMDQGINIYTPTEGLPRLREAIAAKMKRFYGVDVLPEQVLVSDGATGAFYTACLSLLEPGDEAPRGAGYYSDRAVRPQPRDTLAQRVRNHLVVAVMDDQRGDVRELRHGPGG